MVTYHFYKIIIFHKAKLSLPNYLTSTLSIQMNRETNRNELCNPNFVFNGVIVFLIPSLFDRMKSIVIPPLKQGNIVLKLKSTFNIFRQHKSSITLLR